MQVNSLRVFSKCWEVFCAIQDSYPQGPGSSVAALLLPKPCPSALKPLLKAALQHILMLTNQILTAPNTSARVLPRGSDLTSEQQAVLVLTYFFLWFKFDFIVHKKCQMDSWEDASALPCPGMETCSGNWKMQLVPVFKWRRLQSVHKVCFHGPSVAGLFQVQDHQQTQWRLEKTTDPQVFTT